MANLIDTRKRKLPSSDRRDSAYASSLSPTPKMPRLNVDLGSMLYPAYIPDDKYRSVQDVLDRQGQTIADRGAEIEELCAQIHDLREDLKKANGLIDRDRESIGCKNEQLWDLDSQLKKAKADLKELRSDVVSVREFCKRKSYWEERDSEQNEFMAMGAKVLGEKTEEAKRLEQENQQLRTVVGERDGTISALNAQLLTMSMASPDERANMAIEIQAQRTLDRDASIANYKARNAALAEADRNHKSTVGDLSKTIAHKNKALEAAGKHVTEAKAITEDQAKLIERLRKENARLLTN
ncbi:hypothetical protein LTR37_015625 [Vermiconidia calcicola]|uniref:Uncharacterized protein n=1 Tax=Vermiconidia calcicola TaxID=1690605 RepID=A0ACC3MQU5_9PEZI|nr:hypothetical protein LTR37_015625 [Vermiconidia calcicola]